MKSKWFRYFFRQWGETTVGIINADSREEAIEIFDKKYSGIIGSCVYCTIELIEFKDGCCELYYGG